MVTAIVGGMALIAFLALRQAVIDAWMAYQAPKVTQREAQAAHGARLAADADYEHWHAQWGDERVATYGRWQP